MVMLDATRSKDATRGSWDQATAEDLSDVLVSVLRSDRLEGDTDRKTAYSCQPQMKWSWPSLAQLQVQSVTTTHWSCSSLVIPGL